MKERDKYSGWRKQVASRSKEAAVASDMLRSGPPPFRPYRSGPIKKKCTAEMVSIPAK